jgi:MFS family permease
MEMLALLRRRPDLARLWLGEVVAQAGDALFQIALLWLVLELTGSAGLTGLVAMSGYLPTLLFGLLAGALADRVDRRRVLLAANAARAALALAIPALAAAGLLGAPLLGAITFLMAVCTAHFNPTRDAIVADLVEPAELRPANTLVQSGWQFAMLGGPALAGLLIPFTGELHLFTADGLGYLLSAWLILGMRTRPAVTQGPAALDLRSFRAELRLALAGVREGLAFARRDRRIWAILLVTAADNLFIMGPAIVGTPLFVRQTLGGDSGDYAFLLTAFAAGMLSGSLLLNLLGKRARDSRLLLWGIVLDGITFLPLLWVRTFAGAWWTIAVHSLMIPLIIIPRPTLVQRLVPRELQGRVFSMIAVAVTGLSAVSVGLTGLAAEWVPIPVIFGAIAVLGSACGLAGWLIREFREA